MTFKRTISLELAETILGRECPHDNEGAPYCRHCALEASNRRSYLKRQRPKVTPTLSALQLARVRERWVADLIADPVVALGRGRRRKYTLGVAEDVLGRPCPHDRTYEPDPTNYCRRCANQAALKTHKSKRLAALTP
jgi:hypothetical protein